jgi:hypothetical protein
VAWKLVDEVVPRPKWEETVAERAAEFAARPGRRAGPAGIAQPGIAQPGIAQPGIAQPGIAQPGITQPGITQPGITQPGITQPGITQPGITQPGITLAPLAKQRDDDRIGYPHVTTAGGSFSPSAILTGASPLASTRASRPGRRCPVSTAPNCSG